MLWYTICGTLTLFFPEELGGELEVSLQYTHILVVLHYLEYLKEKRRVLTLKPLCLFLLLLAPNQEGFFLHLCRTLSPPSKYFRAPPRTSHCIASIWAGLGGAIHLQAPRHPLRG